jgi:glycosyltransferase involved in cell wall biosynthesis
MRYIWDLTFDYLQASSLGQGLPGIFTRYLFHRLRQWDVISANRVDYFIANSHHTARRIWRAYRRTTEVIYPPVEVDRFVFKPQKQDFYLTVSRLVSYKKVDLIVKAFNQLGRSLVVIGNGPELQQLRQIARPNIQILGFQPNEVVEQYIADAKAFVYASCEDFGIALVEAQASGTPVIAYGAGGALETVRDIRQHPKLGTGLFFLNQTEEALIDAIRDFETCQQNFNPTRVRQNAAQFNAQVFSQRFFPYLKSCYQEFKARNPT